MGTAQLLRSPRNGPHSGPYDKRRRLRVRYADESTTNAPVVGSAVRTTHRTEQTWPKP